MKRIFPLFFLVAAVVVLISATASVALAEQPPGVAPATKMDIGSCGIVADDSFYWGPYTLHYSNGATGHITGKCKLELMNGDPVDYYYEEWCEDNCCFTISIEGEKGMGTVQCFGEWYPPIE